MNNLEQLLNCEISGVIDQDTKSVRDLLDNIGIDVLFEYMQKTGQSLKEDCEKYSYFQARGKIIQNLRFLEISQLKLNEFLDLYIEGK